MVVLFVVMFITVGIVSFLWVKGIDNMKNKHTNYKGEDFLDWDDNKVNSEGTF